MNKKNIKNHLASFNIGISIGYIITILYSIKINDGYFHPVTLELTELAGNEINAVILQTFLCGVMGIGFSFASLIWQIDSWSISKQSGIYFLIAAAIMLPISYFANWMPHTTTGILSYIGIFIAIFVVVWIIQYLIWKTRINKINNKIKKQ